MNRITTGLLLSALVTATSAGAQTRAADKRFDSFSYARLGYGGVFGDGVSGGPAIGFGFRGGFDSFGIDVSFLNLKVPGSDVYGSSGTSMAGSLLKLEGLYFLKPKASASAYLGAGFSLGGTDVSDPYDANHPETSWHGSGLQGELTVGYEWPRASPLRTFVQADATLPFYEVTSISYSVPRSGAVTSTTRHRYSPSLVVSVGLGWQRRRHGRP